MSPEHHESTKAPELTTLTAVESKPDAERPTANSHGAVSPATLILQWLTYAFWGGTILALSVLTFLVIFNLINGSDSETASLYTLAAIIVLLPISLVCDALYQKREPRKKIGASAAILAIHAVIFALVGIGILISGLFSIIGLITDSNTATQSNSQISWLISSLIVTALYAMVFVRTINPFKSVQWFPRIHAIAMSVVIVIFTVLAFTGPFADTFKGKNDRFIRENIGTLSSAIDQYVQSEETLPRSLNELSLRDEGAKRLVDEQLVTYKQDTATADDFRYQLCVQYTTDYKGTSYGYDTSDVMSGNYRSYPSVEQGHDAGEHCYKLSVAKPASAIDLQQPRL